VAWYQEWFGQEYLELYSHRDAGEAGAHVTFVESVLEWPRPTSVLDLACGAGRHTRALRQRGFRALGVDLSLTLLTESPDLPRVAGDIRCLPFAGGTFDWVLSFFTSFGYFESERQNFLVLEEVARILRPGGHFLLDLFNRERVIRNLVATESRELAGSEAKIERWFDRDTQRVNKRIEIRPKDGPARTFVESVRAYSEEEVVVGLRWAGLELDASYGNFDGGPYGRDSERLILAGRRPR
jgi:SAM-dependent methyltransferase